MAVLKENLEGQLKTPKVIRGIQVMGRKIPKQLLKLGKEKSQKSCWVS